ncbi:DUF6932 family protein [Rhizobium ruizarguesonis]|uniref:DUF6932 family protein n=1 Tax=Rhizobium ruizarguesonis TaxID=2081791 RepID=UPI00371C44A0
MPIPAFNAQGMLPPTIGDDPTTADRSPYFVTMLDFVRTFATSGERKALLRNLIAYRDLIAADDYQSGIQFLDGSFVENVEATRGRAPKDIDIFSMLHAPQKYLADMSLWQSHGFPFWSSEIADLKKNQEVTDDCDFVLAPKLVSPHVKPLLAYSLSRTDRAGGILGKIGK